MYSLYELTGDFLTAQEMLFDDEVDTETMLNTLDCINCMIEEKADNYAKIMKFAEGQISLIKNERERLYKREKMLEEKCQKMKEHLKESLEITGKTKFKTALHTFSVCQNGGVQPIKIDVDVTDIPEKYTIPQPPKADMNAIREALLKNEVLPWAHLEEKGTSLRIR